MPNTKNQPQVLMLHWAGADWQIIQPLLDAGKLPNLHQIINKGMMGKLMSLSPKVAPMLTASLVTGQYADCHNILGYAQSEDNPIGMRPINSTDLKSSPLWQQVNDAGKKALAVGWPATQPASVFDGIVVSDDYAKATGKCFAEWPLKSHCVSDLSLHEIMHDLRLHPSEISKEQILSFLPYAAEIDQETDERLPLLVAALSRVTSVHGAATWLAEQKDWDLLMVHFDFLESICNAFLQYSAPRMSHVSELDAKLYGEVVDSAYQFMDLLLGRYLALIDDDSIVMLVSNHGYLHGDLRLAPKRQQNISDLSRHFSEFGILACCGPNIHGDQLIFGATLLDVAPTVLDMLDLPVNQALPGKVLSNLFKQALAIEQGVYPGFDGSAKSPTELGAYPDLSLLVEMMTLGYLPTPCSAAKADPELMAENVQIRWLNNLAKVQQAQKAFTASLATVDKILALDPDNAEARFTGFYCHLSQKNFSACQILLDDLNELGFLGADLDRLQGELLIAQGYFEKALPHLTKAQQSNHKSWRLLERLGVAYLNADQWLKASSLFQQALALNPEFAMAHSGLGVALAKQKQHKAAAEAFMRSLGLLYQQPATHLNLGLSLAATGQLQQAQQAVKNALEIQPDFDQASAVLEQIQRAIAKTMLVQTN